MRPHFPRPFHPLIDSKRQAHTKSLGNLIGLSHDRPDGSAGFSMGYPLNNGSSGERPSFRVIRRRTPILPPSPFLEVALGLMYNILSPWASHTAVSVQSRRPYLFGP